MPDRDYYLKDRHDAIVMAYENYATQMAILFGANSMVATEDIQDMVDFEIKLANVIFIF
jgi:membrane metallo-endopeptidase-like protein 1